LCKLFIFLDYKFIFSYDLSYAYWMLSIHFIYFSIIHIYYIIRLYSNLLSNHNIFSNFITFILFQEIEISFFMLFINYFLIYLFKYFNYLIFKVLISKFHFNYLKIFIFHYQYFNSFMLTNKN